MDSRTRDRPPTADAVEFVRFCYRRRRVGWPEIYDEMCGVAGRGLFRGWGSDELSAEGIGFSLFETANLAALVHRVVAEEQERRTAIAAVKATPPGAAPAPEIDEPIMPAASDNPVETAVPATLRFAGATAGA